MEYGLKKSPQKESDKSKPLSGYGKSKLFATNYLMKISEKKNTCFSIKTLSSVWTKSRQQSFNTFCDYAMFEKKFPCSSGTQYRDFLYIDDFIRCIELTLRKK